MKPIIITIKNRLSNIQSIRSIIKKNGYNVGSWYANGRITGMSNFFGDIEVKELYISQKIESKKISDGLYKHIYTKTVGVEINFFNNSNKLIKVIYKIIKDNGYDVKINNDSIEVFKKITKAD